jgi:hypothetical protein
VIEVERALARALLAGPDEGGPALDPGADEVLGAARALIATLPRDERLGCRALFWAMRFLPLAIGPRRGRFERLAREDARAFLERLRLSRLRALRYLFFCVKSLFAMVYYTRPATCPAIGYDGPYLGRVSVTRLAPLPLAAGELPPAPPPPRELGRDP